MKNIFESLKNEVFHFTHKTGRELEAVLEAAMIQDQSEGLCQTLMGFIPQAGSEQPLKP